MGVSIRRLTRTSSKQPWMLGIGEKLMGLFDGIFGPSESSQRRSQMMQYYLMQQQQQQQALANRSQFPEFQQPSSPATPATPTPVDPTAFRVELMGQLNNAYGPGYSSTQFADTADDDIINAILGKQRT